MQQKRLTRTALFVVALLALTGIVTSVVDMTGTVSAQNPMGERLEAADRPVRSLRDLSNAFVEIAEKVNPSVVTVFSERVMRVRNPFYYSPFGDFFGRRGQPEREYRQQGLGSGIIVSVDGYILTNNHVIQNADSIYVRTIDNEQHTATVVGTDPKTDVAVLKVDADGLTPIVMGNSDNVRVGEWVLAIGSPLSADLAQTVTQGIVSAKGRSNVGLAEYEDFIQTDAAINPGNSGGPLVNLDGELIGINTAILSRSGGNQGIGFAVPVNMAANIMESLMEHGKVVRGYLGVTIQDISPAMMRALDLQSTEGAIIGQVVEDSPADQAGLQDGDIVVELQGQPIENSTELKNRIASTLPDTRVDMTIIRDGKRQTIDVVLGDLDGGTLAAAGLSSLEELLGFAVANLDSESGQALGLDPRERGVVVTSVDQDSPAYRNGGLREGDIIRSVNRRKVRNSEEFTSLVSNFDKGDDILLRIQRDNSYYYVAFTL